MRRQAQTVWPSKRDHKEVWLLAWPMMLSNITVPLVGLVDTAVIGHLPDGKYLAAVAIGSMIFSIVYWAFGFLRMGTTGLTAQAVGAYDYTANRTLLAQSLVMATLIGLSIILLQNPIIELALHWISADSLVTEEARQYAAIRVYGAPAVLCNFALLGWFLGNQNSKIPLLLLTVTNLLNMILDIIAVYGLGMHANGLALATVLAEYGSLLLGLYLCRRLLRPMGGKLLAASLSQVRHYSALLQVNRYLFIRTLALLFSMAFFTAQGARQSTDILSANAVLLNFILLISNGLDGFAHATEALIGKRTGRQDMAGFYRTVTTAAIWSVLTALLFTLFFWAGGGWIIQLLTSIKEVQHQAMIYLPWLVILPLIGVWSFLLDGIFIGTTQVKAMQNTMLFSVFGVFLPLWWLLLPFGNHGLWIAYLSLFFARGVSGGWVFWQLSRKQEWPIIPKTTD